VAAGVLGSSAAGEFPKFAAARELDGSATAHVLVKFSGDDDSPAVRRWADLLVCEHLALDGARALPTVASARSRTVAHAGRTFLEVERFDRVGNFGRRSLCSLEAVNAAFIGSDSLDWTVLATRLAQAGLLDAADAYRITLLWWYGRLIGNTDMHLGNLSFWSSDRFVLAPAYDLLPMLYAPLPGGELPARELSPPLPLPAQREAWLAGAEAATAFWGRAATHGWISASFRATCAANADRVRALASAL
jgi:serine/threonine protein kinase HipA of HipAB toxin-antitoxin module